MEKKNKKKGKKERKKKQQQICSPNTYPLKVQSQCSKETLKSSQFFSLRIRIFMKFQIQWMNKKEARYEWTMNQQQIG
jgi:hypothetical protein